MIHTDSIRHCNDNIRKAVFAEELNKVILLDQLATNVALYNPDLTIFKILKPYYSQNEREVVILDFAWS